MLQQTKMFIGNIAVINNGMIGNNILEVKIERKIIKKRILYIGGIC